MVGVIIEYLNNMHAVTMKIKKWYIKLPMSYKRSMMRKFAIH